MSYDIEIWSVGPSELPAALPTNTRWESQADSWVLPRKTWQLVVEQSAKVWPEDIPDEIVPALPGISYLTRLHLERSSWPTSAVGVLNRTARKLAQATRGVIFDPQLETLAAPSGVKRFQGSKRSETFAVLQLKWWFLDGPLLEDRGVSALVGVLEKFLPEALPKRFGLYEPPQHVYQQEGRSGFELYLAQHLEYMGNSLRRD
jgi:hypothetical protein